MDFQLSPEDATFQEEVRTWLSDHRQQIERTRADDWEQGGEAFERHRAWERALFDAGLAAIAWPKEYGGRGAALMEPGRFPPEDGKAAAAGPNKPPGPGPPRPTPLVVGPARHRGADPPPTPPLRPAL